MTTDVKRTISLPPELAREAEEVAKAEGKTLSGVMVMPEISTKKGLASS